MQRQRARFYHVLPGWGAFFQFEVNITFMPWQLTRRSGKRVQRNTRHLHADHAADFVGSGHFRLLDELALYLVVGHLARTASTSLQDCNSVGSLMVAIRVPSEKNSGRFCARGTSTVLSARRSSGITVLVKVAVRSL